MGLRALRAWGQGLGPQLLLGHQEPARRCPADSRLPARPRTGAAGRLARVGNLLTSWARRPLPPRAHSAHRPGGPRPGPGRPSGAAGSPPRLAPHPQRKTTQGALQVSNHRARGRLPTPQGLFLVGSGWGTGSPLRPQLRRSCTDRRRSALRRAGPRGESSNCMYEQLQGATCAWA